MSEKDSGDPIKARTDLVDILRADPINTETLVTLIETELQGFKDKNTIDDLCKAVSKAAKKADLCEDDTDNLLFWLTETSPDARQMILVQTIEKLLENEQTMEATLDALRKVSSEANVSMVMQWVDKKILTLNQAVYVLLYPDSTQALT